MACGQQFHPEVVQEPFERGQPGGGVPGPQGQFDLVDGISLVQGAVGVAGLGDLPGEPGEHHRFGDLGVGRQRCPGHGPYLGVHPGG